MPVDHGTDLADFLRRREKPMSPKRIVKDLVRPLDRCFRVKEDVTLLESLRLLDQARRTKRPPCLIVIGIGEAEGEIIKGFVTPREVVYGLTARFLRAAEKSGPIFWEGQLEAECFDGFGKAIGEIMIPIGAYVREGEMLMEAVFLLYRNRTDFLPVANEGEVIGTIHIDDILNEIIGFTLEGAKAGPKPEG